MNLLKSGNSIKTIFGLNGNDENALSSALGYLYTKCPLFLRKTLNRLEIKDLRSSNLAQVEVRLQHRHEKEDGITDIEIELKGIFKIIMEAKIGVSEPGIEQCRKYLPRLKTESNGILVILQNTNHEKTILQHVRQEPEFKEKLKGILWGELIEDSISLFKKHGTDTLEGFLLRQFVNFAREEYYMKSYTEEIWIVSASTEPLWPNGWSLYDIHKNSKIYFRKDKSNCRPLYIAFRQNGFDSIYKVEDVLYDSKVIDHAPELKNVKESWPKEPMTIWRFGEPIPLGKKIETGSGMYNRHVYCTFRDLLLYSSVSEIEKNRSIQHPK